MIDVASDEYQSDYQLSPTAAPPGADPGRGRRSLARHSEAEAEAYLGAVDRRSLHKTPGLYIRAWRRFRSN